MRLLVDKATKTNLVLILDPIEAATNQYRCQDWFATVHQGGPIVDLMLEADKIKNLKLAQSPVGELMASLTFETEDALKDWVMERSTPVVTEEEYLDLCRQYGRQPESPHVQSFRITM